MKYRVLSCSASLLIALAGCATTTPAPSELIAARSAFERARNGPASRVALVDLHNARRDLDRAEAAFSHEPEAPVTRDLAYIALRRAQIAESHANELVNEERLATIESQGRERARQQLAQAESTMRVQQSQLQQQQGLIQAERQARTSTEMQLEASEQARMNAEREAAAALASLRQLASVREEQRGMVITLSGEVLFATGESTLLPIAQQRLDQVAQALQTQGSRRIVVEGHTDSRGSSTTNQALSQSRAQAVRAYLVSRGVRPEMIEAVGLGPSRPVADNETAEGRANNRRVEIIIQPSQIAGSQGNAVPASSPR